MTILKNYFKNKMKKIKSISKSDDLNEEIFLSSLEDLVNSYYESDLCFFEISFTYEIRKKKDHEPVNSELSAFEYHMSNLNFVEFILGRKMIYTDLHTNKNRDEYINIGIDLSVQQGKFVFLIAVKSLISVKEIIQSDTLNYLKLNHAYKIKYLKKKNKIKSCLLNITIEDNPMNLYYFNAHRMEYYFNDLSTYFDDSQFKVKPFHKLYFYSKYNKELRDSIGPGPGFDNFKFYNNLYICSTKKSCYLSVINIWSCYMILNNLYYCKDDKKLYKKNKKNYSYFGELDYLSKNVKNVIEFLREKRIIKDGNRRLYFYSVLNYLEEAVIKLELLAPLLFPTKEKEEETFIYLTGEYKSDKFKSIYDEYFTMLTRKMLLEKIKNSGDRYNYKNKKSEDEIFHLLEVDHFKNYFSY